METVRLNVGGKLFETTYVTLQQFPNTRLGALSKKSEAYNVTKQVFFFDRNPEIFNWILDYYRTGQLHFPDNVCGASLRQELQFWRIEEDEISECCWKTYYRYQDDMDVISKLKQNFKGVSGDNLENIHVTKTRRTMMKIWLFLDRPDSSRPAKIFNLIYLLFVLLSSVTYCLSSHPDFRLPHMKNMEWSESEQLELANITNFKIRLFLITNEKIVIFIINKSCMCFFTLELFLHFMSCPEKKKFFKEFLNALDLFLFFSMWTSFTLEMNKQWFLRDNRIFLLYIIARAFFILRMFRFFRLAKQYSGMKVLLLAVATSMKELFLLLISFLIASLVFAGLIYYAEIHETQDFQHIPISLWWAIVTMTTVGYGDHYPRTTAGYIIGACCAMWGILLLAMPIAIIAANFGDFYSRNRDRERHVQLKLKKKIKKIQLISKCFNTKVADIPKRPDKTTMVQTIAK